MRYLKAKTMDHVTYDIRGPILELADSMEEQGEQILRFNIGNPAAYGFKAPSELMDELQLHLSEAQGYSNSRGLKQARIAVAERAAQKGIVGVTPRDVYTGNGVSELIMMSMQAVLDRDDEILVPAPDYPLWTSAINLFRGRPVHYICDEKADWYPDIDDIKRKISPRTKGIVIINPNNPTGALYPREILEQIIEIARENELTIFSDEIYERLIMEGEHVSTAALAPDLPVFTYNGLSKSHLLTGYRCGWMTLSGPRKDIKSYAEAMDVLASMRLCSNVPAQSLIPAALAHGDATRQLYMPGGRMWEQREIVYNGLSAIDGVSVVKPRAAFYIFPRIDAKRFGITDDQAFALELLKQKKVLIVHGSGFNWPEPDHFRMVYLAECDVLSEAVRRIGDFLGNM